MWRGRHLHPDHLTMVIVGDRKTIRPSVQRLNPGSIKAMTIDGVAPASDRSPRSATSVMVLRKPYWDRTIPSI
jgi:hypothetical protein